MPPPVAHGGSKPGGLKPSTSLHAPPPPPLSPTDLLAAVTKRVQGAGLLLTKERSTGLPITDTGISLAYLRALSRELSAPVNGHQKLIEKGTTTDAVVQRFVVPTTKARKCRLFDMVPPEHTGKPQWYVVHAWGASFFHMVEQLHHSLTLVDEDDAPPIDDTQLYLWIDVFAVSQHPQLNVHADVTIVKDLVKSCSQGAAVVMDRQLVALNRLWCAYEMWAFVNYVGIGAVKVCLPEPATVHFVQQFEAKLRQSDVMRLDTSKQEDKSRLLSEIKSSVGMKIMHKTYQESLLLNVRAYLRWKHDLSYLGLYCALLLKEGELSHLQQVLHGIPELQDDEKMLREIEDIFATYVTTPGDELDMTQFSQVLAAAGFDEAEARGIFHEVNTDGSGGVGIDEFKSWWMASQRQDSSRHKAPLHLTTEALVENIDRMEQLLRREGHKEVAQVFKDYLLQVGDGRGLRHGTPLPISPLKGDWQNSSDQVSWKLHNHDYRGAASIIFDVLMWNGDVIQVPPSQLPRAEKQQSYTDFFKALALYLDLFGQLLRWQPGRRQHSEYYRKFSMELRSPMVASMLADAQKSAGGSHAKLDFEKFSVVRDMITLKYGDNQPIHHSLIVEAEKSLASWMAGNRLSNSDVTRQKVKSNLNNLYSDYLSNASAAGNRAADGSVLTLPNQNKRPNFRRTSALVTDTESVLARLGPDAVAFLQSQQAAESKAAARGTSSTPTGSQSQVMGVGEDEGAEGSTSGSTPPSPTRAPEGGAGAADAAAAAAASTSSAGGSAGMATKPRASDAGAGRTSYPGGGGASGTGASGAAPSGPRAAGAGGKARRGSMLASLEGYGLRESEPDISTMMSGGGAFGQVQGTLRRVAAGFGSHAETPAMGRKSSEYPAAGEGGEGERDKGASGAGVGVGACAGYSAPPPHLQQHLQLQQQQRQQQQQQGPSSNTLDVLGRIYAKSQAALDRAVAALGGGSSGGGGQPVGGTVDSAPGTPSGTRGGMTMQMAVGQLQGGLQGGSHLGPGMSPRAPPGGAGLRARRASAVLPDGSCSAASHSFSGGSADIAQLAAATPAGLGGINIRLPRGRRASSIDLSASSSSGGVWSGAGLSPGRMAGPSFAHGGVSRGGDDPSGAGAAATAGSDGSAPAAPLRSDPTSPGASGSLPKISMGSFGAGTGSFSGAAGGPVSPGTPTRTRSLLAPSGGTTDASLGHVLLGGELEEGGAAGSGSGGAAGGGGGGGSRLGRGNSNLASPRPSVGVPGSGGSFSLPRIMAVKGA